MNNIAEAADVQLCPHCGCSHSLDAETLAAELAVDAPAIFGRLLALSKRAAALANEATELHYQYSEIVASFMYYWPDSCEHPGHEYTCDPALRARSLERRAASIPEA